MFKKRAIGVGKKKHILIYLLTAIFAISGLFLLNITSAQDLMEQAFSSARTYDTIIDIGNTKDAVGNEILRESATIGVNENFGQGCFINQQFVNLDETGCAEQGGDWNIQVISASTNEPLIVRITKFLLRMTIVLSITMIIYNAVVYMIEALNGKDRRTADAKKNLVGVIAGVVIALMSVSIINLVISIPKSSVKTSDEVSMLSVACKIGSTIIEGNDLREEICLNSTFGHPIETMEFRERDHLAPLSMGADLMEDRVLGGFRCKICNGGVGGARTDCKWKKITTADMKNKCTTDLGGDLIE